MCRAFIDFSAGILSAIMLASAAGAQPSMKPTAPQKMMSPDKQQKMQECQNQAAQRNIAMDERAKFLMDCMTGQGEIVVYSQPHQTHCDQRNRYAG
jgi:hypothetical protein